MPQAVEQDQEFLEFKQAWRSVFVRALYVYFQEQFNPTRFRYLLDAFAAKAVDDKRESDGENQV